MKKNLVRWLIALAVILPCLLISVSAASGSVVASGNCGADGSNVTYKLWSDGELVISGTGAMKNYSSQYNGITTAPWGSHYSSIKKVVIGSGVTSIGKYAFYYCDSLTSVTLGDSVTSIGDSAFRYCISLTSVTMGDSVTSIGGSAFWGCGSLTSVTIPDSVITIGNGAFRSCDSLTTITVSPGNTAYCDIDGVLFSKDQTELIEFPGGREGTYRIPDSVTSIGDSAFWGCGSLTSVTMGDSVTSIGDYAFGYCTSLTSVTMGDSVTSIGNYVFRPCDSLTSVTFLGNMPAEVGTDLFELCNSGLTIYHHEGTIGWPTTGTWQGYPLVMIEILKPTLTGNGRSLSLEGEIFINQYVLATGFEGVDLATEGGLLVWTAPITEENAVYGTQSYVSEGMVANGLYNGTPEYMVRTKGVAAKCYADEVYFRVYVEVAKGEYIYGELTEYSVQTYCQNQLNKASASAAQKELCAQLLHYGAAAQKRFKYNLNDLANANILDQYPAPGWVKS